MKLIIPQSKLKRGLSITERLAGKSMSLPMLNNVLLSAKKNFLTIESTDLEFGVKVWFLAKIEKEGTTVVPASLLSNLIRSLPDEPVKIELNPPFLLIETKNQKGEIKTENPEDFPIIPQTKNDSHIVLSSNVLCDALSQLVDIPLISSNRPEISGIFFSFQKNTIQIASTDSFRLAEKTITLPRGEVDKNISFILPQKTAREIINIFGTDEGGEKTTKDKELKIYLTPNQILIESLMSETPHPQIILVSRLIEGEYPNYQEIIPKSFETQMILERNGLLHQIKTASLFASRTNDVKLRVQPSKNNIVILSQNPNLGQHQGTVSGEIKGKEKEISFNYRFLIDGLSKIKSPKVVFELSEKDGDLGPGVLRPLDDQSYLYVLMPIQVP